MTADNQIREDLTLTERDLYHKNLDLAIAKQREVEALDAKTQEDSDSAAMAKLKEIADLQPLTRQPTATTARAGTPNAVTPSPWAGAVIGRMSKTASGMGLKALLQGTIDVPSSVTVVGSAGRYLTGSST